MDFGEAIKVCTMSQIVNPSFASYTGLNYLVYNLNKLIIPEVEVKP
jgi:hypothetical protein